MVCLEPSRNCSMPAATIPWNWTCDPRPRPLAVVAEFDGAHDCMKSCFPGVFGQLGIFKTTGSLDGIGNHLHLRICKGRHIVAQGIDIRRGRPRLVCFEQFRNTGKHQFQRGHPILIVHEPIEWWAERCFYGSVLRPYHRSTHHLRVKRVRTDGLHEFDGIRKVRAEKKSIALAFGHLINERSEIACTQRINGFMNNPKLRPAQKGADLPGALL